MSTREAFPEDTLDAPADGDRPAPAIEAVAIRDGLEGRHVCPFCGSINDGSSSTCARCTMENTPAARKATKPRIGPWYVLQSRNPAAPGMKWETLLAFVRKGRVKPQSIVRGPTTHQLWRFAAHVKGLSREFGICYSCGGAIGRTINVCPQCNRLQEPPAHPDTLIEGIDEPGRGVVFKEISPNDAPASIAAIPPGTAPSADDLLRAQDERETLARELGAIADARESLVHDREEVEEAREAFEQEREAFEQERQAADAEREALARDRGVFESERAAVARERAVLLMEREAFERERISVIREREIVKLDRETVAREREAFSQNTAALELDRQAIAQERDALAKEREAFHQERSVFAQEREAAVQDRGTFELQREFVARDLGAFEQEREALARDRESLEQEHEALAREREGVARERDAIVAERGAAARDREAVIREREALEGDGKAFADERDAFAIQRESVARERDAINRDREAAARAREAILHERETIDREREMLDRDREAIDRDREALVRNRESLLRERQTFSREKDKTPASTHQTVTKKNAEPALPELDANHDQAIVKAAPEMTVSSATTAKPAEPEPAAPGPRAAAAPEPPTPTRSLWKDSIEPIAASPEPEALENPSPAVASPAPPASPAANTPPAPLSFPSMGVRKPGQREGFLSAKELAAAFKLDFVPSAQADAPFSLAPAAPIAPTPETPEDFKSFVTMMRDRETPAAPRRPRRRGKLLALLLIVGTIGVLAAGMGVFGDQAKAVVGKIRQTLSAALPATSSTSSDPKGSGQTNAPGDRDHSNSGNSGVLPFPVDNSVQPTPIPTPPAPPDSLQGSDPHASVPAIQLPTTNPAPAATRPDDSPKPPDGKNVTSAIATVLHPAPAATQPGNVAAQSPPLDSTHPRSPAQDKPRIAEAPAPSPPERAAQHPTTKPDVAQAQAQARALRGQATDAEIRGDFAEAASFYEQIKKLPHEAWPPDLDLRLKLAREQQNQK
jgi:hypothetical protein